MLQQKVLALLEQRRGELITGGEIARRLGVSRTAVWKAVNRLREDGSEIESVRNSGYRLLDSSDGLSEPAIRAGLTARSMGGQIELRKAIPSTNQYLKAQDTAVLPEGYTVIADEQTGGRGRMGRPFYSPARQGLYLSVLLKPTIALNETPFLTICAAVAVCNALETVCGIDAGIKWVNDIFCGGKKLCGILTEAFVSAEMQAVDYAIVGIGINTGDVAPEVAELATSVLAVTGQRGIRNRLAAEVLNQLDLMYIDFANGHKSTILAAYTGRLFILGKPVQVVQGSQTYPAVAEGLDENGALLVRRPDGTLQALRSGEIRLQEE